MKDHASRDIDTAAHLALDEDGEPRATKDDAAGLERVGVEGRNVPQPWKRPGHPAVLAEDFVARARRD